MSTKGQCMVCFDHRKECKLVNLSCLEHDICKECLVEAVELAIADETHYPLSCGAQYCYEIDTWQIEGALSASTSDYNSLIEQFRTKVDEYSIPSAFRIYCASKECCTAQGHSGFINHKICGETTAVICPDCNSITCRLCRELVALESEHICKADDLDAIILAFIDSLPEEHRWLYQKCFACSSWVNKSEACNHITCRCSAQFCLICGRQWPNSGNGCIHGCPLYEKPIYDEQGYNQFGYHKDTGRDRDGNHRDPNAVEGHNEDYEDDDDDAYVLQYDENGFDQHGYDVNGFDTNGSDERGFNSDGLDAEGYDRTGYDRLGYNRNGFNQNGRDSEGYFEDGHDLDGFDREGFELFGGLHRNYFDDELYDCFGYDCWGFNRAGYDWESRNIEGYDVEGFDAWGYDRDGFDEDGYDQIGFDKHRCDRDGFKSTGFNAHHRDRDNSIESGYSLQPDENVRRDFYEGPPVKVMECEHRTHFAYGSATCFICDWTSDIFHHYCSLCGEDLCRACDGAGVDRQRAVIRNDYLWPGSDSYGIGEMFERVVKSMEFADMGATKPMISRRQSIGGPCVTYGAMIKMRDLGEVYRLV